MRRSRYLFLLAFMPLNEKLLLRVKGLRQFFTLGAYP
jgi:hypothetical protein